MSFTSLCFVAGLLAAQAPGLRELPSGAPLTEEIGLKERHAYLATVPRGGFVRIVVEQYGVDVVARLLGPDGALLTEVDGLTGDTGPETLLLVSPNGGVHRVEVVGPPHGQAARGRYSIGVVESRPATGVDEQRVAATWAYDLATELRFEGSAASLRRALVKYGEALTLWRALGQREGEANALRFAGRVHAMLDEYPAALRFYREALELYRTAGDREVIAILLNDIGGIHDRLSDFDAALAHYEEALELNRGLGQLRGQGTVLHNIAVTHMALDNLDQALAFHAEALPLRRRAQDRAGEGFTLHSLGQTHVALGDYQQGLEYYAQALALRRAIRDREGEGATLHNLGTAALAMGEPEQALGYLEQSLENRRLRGDRRNEAFVLFNMGRAQETLGQAAEAERLFRSALEINRSLADPRGVGRSLKALGDLQAQQGRPREALELFEEALGQLQAGRDRRGEAQARSAAALAQLALGSNDQAEAGLDQALAIQQAILSVEGQADTWAAQARLAEKRGDLAAAQRHLERALALVEELRARVLAPDQRAAFLASKRAQQRHYVDVLMARHVLDPRGGHDAAAFAASDRARARSLREVLLSGASLRADADPQLLERERAVQAQLNAKERQRMRLGTSGGAAARAQLLEREIDDLLTEYRAVQARLRAESPRYSALTAPPAVSLAEIQALLGDRSVLLEYALGETRSFLWVVTRHALSSHVLPPGGQLEASARRVHGLLSKSPQRAERVAARSAAEDLARTLLGPAAQAIAGKRIVVVADGALQYVPFAALPAPGAAAEPLIARHELVMLPSAALAATLREQAAHRPRPQRGVAVFADPVLGADDPRVAAARAPVTVAAAAASDVSRSARDAGVERFERLAYTREEAQAIARLGGADGLLALDFAASRAAALGPELADYRIVHFATHGLVNSRRPELSGVVLSLVDEHGQARDGFLRLHDIYNLRLNAELVVLSACRTALGRQVSGEGLVGLTRGFLFAGAPRVVSSLWDVRDQATAELMSRFYRRLLRDRLPAAAALRAAQLSMWKDPRWRAPFYWSGFSLYGDWQ